MGLESYLHSMAHHCLKVLTCLQFTYMTLMTSLNGISSQKASATPIFRPCIQHTLASTANMNLKREVTTKFITTTKQ